MYRGNEEDARFLRETIYAARMIDIDDYLSALLRGKGAGDNFYRTARLTAGAGQTYMRCGIYRGTMDAWKYQNIFMKVS